MKIHSATRTGHAASSSAAVSPIPRAGNSAPLPSLPPPTIWQMVGNFAEATKDWAAKGFPVVQSSEFDRRLSLCRACEFWEEEARLGAGKCNHTECGCSKLKHWLATSKCPLKLW